MQGTVVEYRAVSGARASQGAAPRDEVELIFPRRNDHNHAPGFGVWGDDVCLRNGPGMPVYNYATRDRGNQA